MQEMMSRLVSIAAVVGMSLAVAACAATNLPASVGGLSEVFHDPGFAVQGKTQKDQRWISETQEAGIRVLGWSRPAKIKIAAAKRAKAKQAAVHKTTPVSKPVQSVPLPPTPPVGYDATVPLQPKKKHWWQR